METFKLNGHVYKAKEVDFNFAAMLGENGIALPEMTKKILPALRVYVAYCMSAPDLELAGNEINMHIINGGNLEDITNVFVEKINESDFFRALSNKTVEEGTETKAGKGSTKKSQSEAEASE